MKNKKKVIVLAIGVISILILVIGASYAYFSATVSGNGNDNGSSSITTAELPSLIYNNGENFNGEDVYPGYKNIHTFTVKPQPNSKGTAAYVLHLNANVPIEFGNDIKVTVYKTTDNINNNLSRTEGTLTETTDNNGNFQYSKEDIIQLNGNLEKVYEQSITNNTDIILEEKEFNETLQETTYYLVYEYVESNNNQNATQGESFNGKVTVTLQRELNPIKPLNNFGIQDTLATEGNGLYEVKHDDAIIEAPLSTLEKNNLKQTEYRYAGVDPNNYIRFNDELWRIIGLVNTPEGSRIKLIRNESIGVYSWDSSEAFINGGYGINEWRQADLMKLLNPGHESETIGGSLYWNRQSGNCYNATNNATIACDFTLNGLNESSKSRIEKITWNTGTNGANDWQSANAGLTKHFYNYERGNDNGKICTSGSNCTDTVARTLVWRGKVGLMSPSDYGYASSGGNIANKETCLNNELRYWNNSLVNDCKMNDWIFNSINQWTINPSANSIDANNVFNVSNGGYLNYYSSRFGNNVRPSIYLILSEKIINGDGSQSNPYILK